MYDFTWSKTEKQIAKRAYDAAHKREYAKLIDKTREMAGKMREPGDLWRLHDFLARTLKEIDEKYDYRYSQLIMVFARLVHQGWLSLEELEGLHEDKLAKIELIRSLARE